MGEQEQQLWKVMRLNRLAARAQLHAAIRLRAGLGAQVALDRSERLQDLACAEWQKVMAC